MEYFLQSHPCQFLSSLPTLQSLSQKEAFCAENEDRRKQAQLIKIFPSTFLQGPSTPDTSTPRSHTWAFLGSHIQHLGLPHSHSWAQTTAEPRLKWHRALTHTNTPHCCSSHMVTTQSLSVTPDPGGSPPARNPGIKIPNISRQQNTASQSHYDFPQSPHPTSLSQPTPPLVICTCQEALLLFPYKDKDCLISAFLQVSTPWWTWQLHFLSEIIWYQLTTLRDFPHLQSTLKASCHL